MRNHVVTVALLVSMLGCGGARSPARSIEAAPSAARPRGAVTLVVLVPTDAPAAVATLRGVQLAADEVNRPGTDEVRLDVRTIDSRQSADDLHDALARIARASPRFAVIGGLTPEATAAAAAAMPRGATAPLLSLEPAPAGYAASGAFRVLSSDSAGGYAAAAFGFARGADPWLLVSFGDVDALLGMVDALDVRNGHFRTLRRYSASSTQSAAQLAQLLAATPAPSAVGIAEEMSAGADVIRTMRRAGLAQPVYAGGGWAPYTLAATPGVDDVYVPVPFSPLAPSAARFVAAFTDTYGEAPTLAAATGYDAALIVAEAARRATDDDLVTPLLHANLTDLPLVTGGFTYNDQRHPAGKETVIVHVSAGAVTFAGTARTGDR